MNIDQIVFSIRFTILPKSYVSLLRKLQTIIATLVERGNPVSNSVKSPRDISEVPAAKFLLLYLDLVV
jgi:hypothetical protein